MLRDAISESAGSSDEGVDLDGHDVAQRATVSRAASLGDTRMLPLDLVESRPRCQVVSRSVSP